MARAIIRRKRPDHIGIMKGFRSGLEGAVAETLRLAGQDYEYEAVSLPWVEPASNHKYTPDFVLPNGIVVETKGYFTPDDRKKMLLVKEQYPDLDIRLVFQRSATPTSKGAKTSYAKWCEKHGFLYADRKIPQSWLDESPNLVSLGILWNHRKKAQR